MQHEITKRCADSLRAFSLSKFGIQIKSSHAHELVAVYFGYSSRASLLADIKYQIENLSQAEIIVLVPTARILERRKELKLLPENLSEDLAEGVYLPLYEEKFISNTIWPPFDYLGLALADQQLNLRPLFFKDQKIQREGVEVETLEEGVRIKVYREYVSPSQILSFKKGTWAVFDIFELKRIAGYIGYVMSNHYWTEAEALNAALENIEKVGQWQTSRQNLAQMGDLSNVFYIGFPDWLKKQKNRESPLGDLARKRGFVDKIEMWPSFDNLDAYKDYLTNNHPPRGSMPTLENAWKTYQKFLKRKPSPKANNEMKLPAPQKNYTRTIVSVKNITPLHFSKRTIEKFVVGDEAWISWNGRKAIPVIITEVDERYYTFRIERPLKEFGNEHYLRLDEIRSTPELACLNCVTL